MKTTNIVIMIIFAIAFGAVLGYVCTNQNRLSSDMAGHAQRISSLETERNERVANKAVTAKAIGFGARCLEKITFGLIKLG